MEAPHLRVGRRAEDMALRFLERRGMTLLARNYRRRCGELDLVLRDGATLVVVEVRFRRTSAYGGAAASIGAHKQRRLARAAVLFASEHRVGDDVPIRFDVVALTGAPARPAIEWIKDAFHPTL